MSAAPNSAAGPSNANTNTNGTGSTTANAPWPKQAIEAASHGAIAFCQIYYEAYDEPSRRGTDLPNLYLPTAKIIWNGNTVSADRPSLSAYFEANPISRHDLQTLDCHPIAAEASAGPAPDLILNVTGSVLQGPAVLKQQPDNPADIPPQDKPRKFHEMFMLRAAEQGEGMQPKPELPLYWVGDPGASKRKEAAIGKAEVAPTTYIAVISRSRD